MNNYKHLSQEGLNMLFTNMMKFLSLADVKVIAFNMGLELDELGGSEKSGKVIALINFCNRRGVIESLIDLCVNTNPVFKNVHNQLLKAIQTSPNPPILIAQSENSNVEDITKNQTTTNTIINKGNNYGVQGSVETINLSNIFDRKDNS